MASRSNGTKMMSSDGTVMQNTLLFPFPGKQ